MRTKDDVLKLLTKLLANGPLERLPKKQSDADVILALAAARLHPDKAYEERDINHLLTAWLEGFASPFGVDHVTVRRFMVDSGFLRRDPGGRAYMVDSDSIDRILAADARSISPGEVLMDLDLARQERKRAHAQKSDL